MGQTTPAVQSIPGFFHENRDRGVNLTVYIHLAPRKLRAIYSLPARDQENTLHLTFWRRNYFFKILAHPVYKL